MDTGPVRSLTIRRPSSVPGSPSPGDIGPDGLDIAPESPVNTAISNGHAVGEPDEKLDEDQNSTAATDSARTSKRVSHTFLDNVDLGDGPPSEQVKGWSHAKTCSRTKCSG